MNSWHTAIGTTPFFLMYGYHPEVRYKIEDDSIRGKVPAANERIKRLQALRDETAERLRGAIETQAKYYNKTHQPQEYKVGQLVMLATKNLKQKRPSKKLAHKYVGPFRIIDKVGAQAYRLLLSSLYRIHNTFYMLLLEPYHLRASDSTTDFMQAPELIDDNELWEIEEIIDKVRNREGVWCKVKWTGWGEEYNQWLLNSELGNARSLTDKFEASALNQREDADILEGSQLPAAPSQRKRKRRKV